MNDLELLKDYCDREIELLEDEIDRLKDGDNEDNNRYILNDQVATTTLKRVIAKISYIQSTT